jgi:hypothetical protein
MAAGLSEGPVLLQGAWGFLLLYGWVAGWSLAGLRRGGAPRPQYLLWPLLALAGTLPAGLLAGLGLRLVGPLPGASPGSFSQGLLALAFSGAGSFAGGLAWARWVRRRRVAVHLRGAMVHDGAALQRAPRRGAAGGALPPATLAGVALAPEDETGHLIILGTTGMGKSTLIRELVGSALARGDRLVMADPDGGYLSRYYDAARGDVILNPFDARSHRWDLFAEILAPYDIDQLARSLIPDPAGSADPQWVQYARTLFESVLGQVHALGSADLGELYRLLAAAPREELRLLLAGTPAAPFLEDNSDKLFGGTRSTLAEHVKAFEYLRRVAGQGFSVRGWVRDAGSGVLFLPYRADQIPALRAIISTWMRLAMVQALSLPEADHRIWFIIDELDALGAIDGLAASLPRLRKFGGRCVLGLQAIAQVSQVYGPRVADATVENCNTKMILRCSASEGGGTARFAARLIGERETLRIDRSFGRTRSAGWRGGSRSRSEAERRSLEPAVLAAQIEQLPRACGYLKLGSRAHWLRLGFGEHDPPRVAPPFVPQR